ncbi:MAG: hypothetical protein MdMp014T_0169 [Treponematales bacterium]
MTEWTESTGGKVVALFMGLVGGILVGVVGQFFAHLVFSIPYILLNNGDILAEIKGKVNDKSTETLV